MTKSAASGKRVCRFTSMCVFRGYRWRRSGSSRCLPPSALWQTAPSSSPRMASSESSVLWALNPRKTRLELCSILTRASWTRPEWRWGHCWRPESCCGQHRWSIECFPFFQVEMCKDFGDPTKARAWSKHSQSLGAETPTAAAAADSKKVSTQC